LVQYISFNPILLNPIIRLIQYQIKTPNHFLYIPLYLYLMIQYKNVMKRLFTIIGTCTNFVSYFKISVCCSSLPDTDLKRNDVTYAWCLSDIYYARLDDIEINYHHVLVTSYWLFIIANNPKIISKWCTVNTF
jgi:hypothetical protein